MTTLKLTRTLGDERLAPFLPLIDSVWKDGDVTDLQIAAVCLALLRTPGIDVSCKEALEHWLDPEHPPTKQDLAALRDRLGADKASVA